MWRALQRLIISNPTPSRRTLAFSAAAPTSLNTISDNPGSRKFVRRLGRGQGSGRGGTSGRGHKGQKARSGASRKIRLGFEGGQTPLAKRLPKRGFTSNKPDFSPLNLDKLQEWIKQGRLNPDELITTKMLNDSGVVGKVKHGVKLLGNGIQDFHAKINIQVTEASKTAQYAIEKNGGSVMFTYFNKLGLRATLHPDKFDIVPKLARPPRKWALKHGIENHL
uniref:Large ribosomal subunit protein uL15/eL18 domain-containing protein n=1 Tax=Spongospora subterranea TaxID=70186 RepID=A0A0H5R5Y5_9EUKA|eukprot:CRZ09271.1 hypothetical protein [Spongospora subterranea]